MGYNTVSKNTQYPASRKHREPDQYHAGYNFECDEYFFCVLGERRNENE